MDENTWRLAQVAMWLVGIQTTVMIALLGAMWASMLRRFDAIDKKFSSRCDGMDKVAESRFDKIERTLDRINNTLTDIDKRVFAIETMLHMKDCCVLKSDSQLKKAE